MKQPDLGKAIAGIRKSKGLTQTELSEKCNITVKTIQRIESGRVTPRSYTVKTISQALSVDFFAFSVCPSDIAFIAAFIVFSGED